MSEISRSYSLTTSIMGAITLSTIGQNHEKHDEPPPARGEILQQVNSNIYALSAYVNSLGLRLLGKMILTATDVVIAPFEKWTKLIDALSDAKTNADEYIRAAAQSLDQALFSIDVQRTEIACRLQNLLTDEMCLNAKEARKFTNLAFKDDTFRNWSFEHSEFKLCYENWKRTELKRILTEINDIQNKAQIENYSPVHSRFNNFSTQV